jgi:hypothetical protein
VSDTAVSITAIVVSGVVGPSFSAFRTRRGQRNEHERELIAELRSVLDQAADVVGIAKRCFERVYNLNRDGAGPSSPDASEAAARWRIAMQEVRYAEARLAIRLGEDHEVHIAFVNWIDTLTAQGLFARSYERGQLSRRVAEKQRESHVAFNGARRAYIDAARRVIGPRL